LYRKSKHILYNITLFSENCAVCEIMRELIVHPGRPQMTIMRMRFTCKITKATDTHSECVIIIAFVRQKWLRERV